VKKLKMILGFLISALFLYLAFRRIDLTETLGIIFSMNIYLVLLSFAIGIVGLIVRSKRWKIFIGHEEKTKDIPVKSFFEATCVGQMMNNILPFRMGDFGQAVFLAVRKDLSKSVVFSTVIMERLVDIFPPLVILFVGSFFVLLPKDIGKARVFITMGIVIAVIAAILIFQSKLMSFLRNIIPKNKFGEQLHKFIEHFYQAAGFVKDRNKLFWVVGFTALLWSLYALSAYLLMLSVNLNKGFFSGFLVLGITAISVAIPSSPGYVGTWEFFCILALSIFKVKKSMALSFAILYHLMAWLPTTVIGAYVLMKSGISFAKLGQMKQQENE
jgi:hypothetical protein